MDSIFFVIKSIAITSIVVLLMQVKWGEQTIEDHALAFVTSSTFVVPIEKTATGAVVFIRNTWSKITKSLNTNFTNALRSENTPGSRHNILSFERSERASKQQHSEEEGEQTDNKVDAAYRSARSKIKDFSSEVSRSEEFQEAKKVSGSYISQIKQKMREVNNRVQSKFVDETRVPEGYEASGASKKIRDKNSASYTDDDEVIDSSNEADER